MQPRFNVERDRENSLFYRSYKNDYCLFQFHSQIEFYFVDEGEMELSVDGATDIISAGEMSVAISFSPHIYRTPRESRSSVLLIPTYLAEQFITAIEGKRLATPFIKDKATVGRIKELYESLPSAASRVSEIGIIYTMLGMVIDAVGLVPRDESMDTALASRLLYYINDNYTGGITPASVAQHFGYNQSYISRYFKSCFGITLSHYITSVRLRSSVMLLLDGSSDVTYAAMESGFSSMRTFYRAFREEYGMTPREYSQREKTKL